MCVCAAWRKVSFASSPPRTHSATARQRRAARAVVSSREQTRSRDDVLSRVPSHVILREILNSRREPRLNRLQQDITARRRGWG